MSSFGQTLARLLAIMLLVIPGWIATAGFLKIKNAGFAWFASLDPTQQKQPFPWWETIWGLVMFLGGIAFIAGWIFYRDRKHNYVAPRFREKKSRPRPPSNPHSEP